MKAEIEDLRGDIARLRRKMHKAEQRIKKLEKIIKEMDYAEYLKDLCENKKCGECGYRVYCEEARE